MNPFAAIHYGGPGAGKNITAISNWWDVENERPREGKAGRLILVGRESNPAIEIDPDMVRHFPVAETESSTKHIEDIKAYLRAVVANQRKDPLTDITFDGWSELNSTYVVDKNWGDDNFAPYKAWKREFITLTEMLNPVSLGLNIFSTARVTDLRDSTDFMKGDPEWMKAYDFWPALDGWAKSNSSHYANFVLHHRSEPVKGTDRARYMVRCSPSGLYYVKNVYLHKWDKAGLDRDWDVTDDFEFWPKVISALEGGGTTSKKGK